MSSSKDDYIRDDWAGANRTDVPGPIDEHNPDDFDGVDWVERFLGPDISDQLTAESEKVEREGSYTRDWELVSWQYRESKAFTCESCDADLSDHKGLLHVHHMNQDKGNNDSSNLEALCILCHSKRHNHLVGNISDAIRTIIIELRQKARR